MTESRAAGYRPGYSGESRSPFLSVPLAGFGPAPNRNERREQVIEVLATCPTHGRQVFRRESGQDWWACPFVGMFESGSCGSVIPDETVTPDGGEVVHISRVQFVPTIDGERRVVTP